MDQDAYGVWLGDTIKDGRWLFDDAKRLISFPTFNEAEAQAVMLRKREGVDCMACQILHNGLPPLSAFRSKAVA